MWIRGVDVPRPLVQAHRQGRLVVFVGAGASRSSPSALPDFLTLARDVAAGAAVSFSERDYERPDVLLGELNDQHNVDVHLRVKARLGAASSKPNRLHKAIAALTAASGVVRVVTTNYDLHLSTTLSALGLPIREFEGPALPIGDDFSGLVYLHGSLRQEPRMLVVTDADFGRAYLRDAWATRFLERMFTEFTVLFIGYSHSDVVMQYLARGLGRDTARFALTDEPNSSLWRRLEIVPVGYENCDDSHVRLVDAIEGWAERASMGMLDHQRRVSELVSSPPSPVPDELSYLEEIVGGRETAAFFAEFARGAEWLTWAAAQPVFRGIFDPASPDSDVARILSRWFAEHYVLNEELTGRALSVICDSGGHLSSATWLSIAHLLQVRHSDRSGEPRPPWLGPWLVLLMDNAPESTGELLDFALTASRWPEDAAVALLLFDYLTEPRPGLRDAVGHGGSPRLELCFRGEPDLLDAAWQGVFVPNLRDAAPCVLPLVERHLLRAHALLAAAGPTALAWDRLSSRSAIEPHGQDRHREAADVLIDAARDSIEALLDAGGGSALPYLERWASSELPILRLLALHGWVQRTDVDATTKLRWLIDRDWLFNVTLRHEVFRLIGAVLAEASRETADALVEAALVGPPEFREHRDYEIFNILAWITQHAPGLPSAREAFHRLQEERPEYAVRDHPDMSRWFETGTRASQPPMSAAQLHGMIGTSAQNAINALRRYEQATSPWEGPDWNDTLGVVTATVREWPIDGLAIFSSEVDERKDILKAVIRGWATATIHTETVNEIIDRLNRDDMAELGDDVARLFANGGSNDTYPTTWHRFPDARNFAIRLWTRLEPAAPTLGVSDWLGWAASRTAGYLSEFWIHALADDWRAANGAWSGIPSSIRQHLSDMLTVGDDRAIAVEVIFASRLHFFHGADAAWCEANVLPLLDWVNPNRGIRTWEGFLAGGRWSDHLLSAGLLDHYLQCVAHAAELREELQRDLHEHLAAIALFSDRHPLDDGWLRKFTRFADESGRVAWTKSVSWQLSHLETSDVEHQWSRWVRRYIQDRLASVPIRLTQEESSVMARWVPYLGDSLPEGVALVVASQAGLTGHANVLRGIRDEHMAQYPEVIVALVAHLVCHTTKPFKACHAVKGAIDRLRQHSPEADLTPIIEAALSLGCSDAGSW